MRKKLSYIFWRVNIWCLFIINRYTTKEIILIDSYSVKELFDILKNINCSIKIITKNINEESKKKYLKQYNNVEIIYSTGFHDRFIIIDEKHYIILA